MNLIALPTRSNHSIRIPHAGPQASVDPEDFATVIAAHVFPPLLAAILVIPPGAVFPALRSWKKHFQ
jgi:hypothetical protein